MTYQLLELDLGITMSNVTHNQKMTYQQSELDQETIIIKSVEHYHTQNMTDNHPI